MTSENLKFKKILGTQLQGELIITQDIDCGLENNWKIKRLL